MIINRDFKANRPEHELLLCCARTRPDERTTARLRRLLSDSIDWNYLYQLARRHSVVPLVYKQLNNHGTDLIPHEWLAQFKQSYQENLARNQVLTFELVSIIRTLKDAGIESIPFKGPVLAMLAYDDLAMRRFVDLDLIVQKDHLSIARDVLSLLGYKPSLDLDQQSIALKTQHNIQFRRADGRVIVELHWEVASDLFASSVSGDELWKSLKTVDVSGESINSLPVDDVLFSLCVHGSRHIWERLSWICDVAELISRREIDWQALVSRATRTDCERMFYLGLFLADRLFGIAVPPDVRLTIEADSGLESIADDIVPRLFSGTTHIPATPAQIFQFNFNIRKSWRGRARYFAFMLKPTDGDLSRLPLPRSLSFAYYLIRPVRLFIFDRR